MVWRCGAGGWASMRAKCRGQACQPEGRGPIWRQGDRQNDTKSLPGKDETGSGDRASRPYFFNPTLGANPRAARRSTHKGKGGPPRPLGLWGPPLRSHSSSFSRVKAHRDKELAMGSASSFTTKRWREMRLFSSRMPPRQRGPQRACGNMRGGQVGCQPRGLSRLAVGLRGGICMESLWNICSCLGVIPKVRRISRPLFSAGTSLSFKSMVTHF